MYRKVSTDMNFVEREKEVLDFWKREGIMEKSFHHRDGAERFTFFDGPPTANGRPHIGHIETRAIKDLIPRFQSMKGKDVLRKAGWDTHGLPVELVFGLLSPENSGAAHLHALAAISRLLRDEDVRDALADAPSEEAMYGLLTNAIDRDVA